MKMPGRIRRRLVHAIVLGFVLASCTSASHPESARGPRPSPNPVRGVNTSREGLEIGVPYRIELHTHCGIDFWTRFDGSFWDAVHHNNNTGNPPRGLGNPVDVGTMMLTSEDEAEYRSAAGRIFLFRRGPERQPRGMFWL